MTTSTATRKTKKTTPVVMKVEGFDCRLTEYGAFWTTVHGAYVSATSAAGIKQKIRSIMAAHRVNTDIKGLTVVFQDYPRGRDTRVNYGADKRWYRGKVLDREIKMGHKHTFRVMLTVQVPGEKITRTMEDCDAWLGSLADVKELARLAEVTDRLQKAYQAGKQAETKYYNSLVAVDDATDAEIGIMHKGVVPHRAQKTDQNVQ